ncbi:MAG: protein kinase, partial [Planctomycetota bacterium]
MIKPGDEPIPGYRVEELLGRGQFGQVWRARSPGNTYVALKFLDLDGRYGWKEFRSVQRVKQIRHAHLMPIVAIWLLDENGQVLSDDAIDGIAADFQDAKNVDVTSETLVAVPIEKSSGPIRLVVANLLADCTLGDRLEECRASGGDGIPIDELLGYMREAAKGLDFLNSSQHLVGTSLGSVQHCDVKPDNIMLSGGSVVISDFGVAQLLAESRRDAKATSLGGTPAFMAPELFRSKPSSTTDQYALAVTYYELRTGKLPFIEHTFAAILVANQTGKLDMSDVETAERRGRDPSELIQVAFGLPECLRDASELAALRDL